MQKQPNSPNPDPRDELMKSLNEGIKFGITYSKWSVVMSIIIFAVILAIAFYGIVIEDGLHLGFGLQLRHLFHS